MVAPLQGQPASLSCLHHVAHKVTSWERRVTGTMSVLQLEERPADDWIQARRMCINMVLGTDLKKHFDIVSRFQASLNASLTC